MSASPEKTDIDEATVRKVAHLARIAITDEQIAGVQSKMNAVLHMAGQLMAVDVTDVAPMVSVIPTDLVQREDIVTDGHRATDILHNTPHKEDDYFMVPKVVE